MQTEDREGSVFLSMASIIAPIIYVTLYSLDNTCAYLPSANIDKICQLYAYNDTANTILTFSSNLANTIMPILFMPYLLIAIVINVALLPQQRFEFLSRHSRLFRIFSGAYLGLGVIFSIISLAATSVIIYMAIIFGSFWIKSTPAHPVNMQALAMNNVALSLGLCFFALVPVLAMLPYRSMYKEYDAYLNVYHPKDKKNAFRTGVLIAILLICLDVFLHQLD